MKFHSVWFLFLAGFPVMLFSAASEAQEIPPCEGASQVIQSDGMYTVRFKVATEQPICKKTIVQDGIKAIFCIQMTEEGQKLVPCEGSPQAMEPAPAATEPPVKPPTVQVAPTAAASAEASAPKAESDCPTAEASEPERGMPACLSQMNSAPAVIKCDCQIFPKAEYDPWIEGVEGKGKNVLAAVNDAFGKCEDLKKNTNPPGLYKAAKLVGCPSMDINFPD